MAKTEEKKSLGTLFMKPKKNGQMLVSGPSALYLK
jgi:hypothetical protein